MEGVSLGVPGILASAHRLNISPATIIPSKRIHQGLCLRQVQSRPTTLGITHTTAAVLRKFKGA